MPRAASSLPTWRHIAVTWALPDDFGGMTSVILRRSAGFAAAGAPVTVVTFDDRLDTRDEVARLRASGVLHPGVEVLHLWDWLAENPLRGTDSVADLSFAPLDTGSPDHVVVEYDGVVRRREARDADGTAVQVDRYRPDGSLLASDRRAVAGRPRSVVVCDADGNPVRGWSSMWGLYRHWLDRVTDKRRSMLVVDSKTAARFVHGYRRKHVATVHVVHSSHRSGSGEPGSPLKASRRETLENAASFDAVVALTERQRADLVADIGADATFAVVPNASPIERLRDAPLPRDPRSGVMLASLNTRKRIGLAVAAVAEAGVSLDVYGEGPERTVVEEQIAALGADARVRLLGHRSDAALAFRGASFSPLTSTAEGSPLVIVESMAAGCIPIAYDIRYGPGDTIRDGVDGFLVPPGDVAAMAARMREVAAMPERRRRRMRRAAKRSASRFSEARVTDDWAELFSAIAVKRWPASAPRTLRARVGGRVRRLWRAACVRQRIRPG